ncbi:Response regulator receiver domain-containing protein [Methanolobus vulcani]|jgi:CheY-like chemotaxis protein|uniref:Response regulator receiver domain-containing protein n=1 Tax=Methanolobus vulcani TaxID=38026 RepID=A0A7Z7FEM7_9EURY|nr:response regulator [Methanolobus vulcani]MDK2947151.1 two-component system, response regulator PdtaR [Methanolobus sp.]SDF92950.1 Response regulator receiver domain-containing protein [Methanolobus vulcani]
MEEIEIAPKILVVEDENIVALELKKRLKKLGYQVPSVAASGIEAINKAEGFLPDLVIMDIRLKGDMDGIQTAQIIHERFNIPVIYLTAHSDDETLKRAKKTEPYGYILKPFEEDELRTAIEIAVYKHQMEMSSKK